MVRFLEQHRTVPFEIHTCRYADVQVSISYIGTEELIEGQWTRESARTSLLCMPGGADLPYCKHLSGRGNDIIRGGYGCD